VFAVLAPVCTMAVLIASSHAVALHALNASIRPRIIKDVAARSLFLLLVVPWIWYWTVKILTSGLPEQGPEFRLLLFTVLSVVNAAIVAWIAHRRLYRDFRHAVAGDFESA
jgi:hypothetical protein